MFATGVTIVTARAADGSLVGLTANSFNSVSLDPPLVLWSLAHRAGSMPHFSTGSHYAINILAADQKALMVDPGNFVSGMQQLAEMLEFFTAMKGAFKVLNWVGKVAKPLAAIVMLGGACVGFWTAIKGVTSR